MELTFAQKFREHYNVENTHNCKNLYQLERHYYNEHNKRCSWEDGVTVPLKREKHPEKTRERNLIKSKSNHLVTRKLNCEYNGEIHSIHHCFGDVVESFVIMNKQDHKDLHKKFGKFNEDCLLTNEQVKEFIMNHEHILVENGKIIENTFTRTNKS